ncbi:hypothetical protein Sjap_012951 [Stephania japonica]|uniref:Uncharacterized protein n=1 Tax=Stephania japonica TaxID=461633 RepID=A0AAP0IX17_9MAGN
MNMEFLILFFYPVKENIVRLGFLSALIVFVGLQQRRSSLRRLMEGCQSWLLLCRKIETLDLLWLIPSFLDVSGRGESRCIEEGRFWSFKGTMSLDYGEPVVASDCFPALMLSTWSCMLQCFSDKDVLGD